MDVRSIIGVLGGVVLVYFLSQILEPPLVMQLAPQRPTNNEELLAAAMAGRVLVGRVILGGFIGLLAGYMAAKIAGQHELAHAGVSAALQAAMRGSSDPTATWPLIAVTALAMLVGASIRARAARFEPPTEVRS